jgi:valyl-tRNA synthetase
VLQGDDAAAAAVTRRTLLDVLETLLRALHPVMPFITEEIWLRVAPLAGVQGETLMLASWPERSAITQDADAERTVQWMQGVILGVRQVRGEMDISPARKLPLLVRNATTTDVALLAAQRSFLQRMAGLESLEVLAADAVPPPSAAAVVGEMTLLVPMAGLIEPATELARLAKRLDRTRQEIAKANGKLANASFVANAPPEVVAQERERIAQFEKTADSLARQMQAVEALLAGG